MVNDSIIPRIAIPAAPRAVARMVAVFGLAGLCLIPDSAVAQTYQTWRNEATSGSWQGSINWWKGSAGPIEFGQQEWDNNHYTSQTNDNGGSTFNTWRFLFKSGASSAHTFTGDAVRFNDYGGNDPSIINQSSATHSINLNIQGDGDAGDPLKIQIDNNGGGGLTFGGTVNNQGSDIHVIGTASSAATVRFNDVISGSAGFYKENSNIVALFDAANTYTGQLTIQAGTVRLNDTGDTFGASTQDIRLHSTGVLDLNGVSTTVGSVAEYGSANSGTITLGSGTLTIAGADKGTFFQNSISGSGGLTMAGSGSTIMSLFGTQSYTGTTTVSSGSLTTAAAMSSTAFVISGGNFSTQAADQIADTATVTINSGSLLLAGADTVGALSGSGGTLTINGSYALTTNSSSSTTYSGVIAGTGGQLVKAGSGTLTLNGSNTYTGTTTISAGALRAAHANALGTTAAGTTVQNGGVLELAGGISIGAEALSIQGTGISVGGALRNISGDNSYAGAITLAGAARINSDADLLTLSGGISGTHNLTLGGAGNTTVSGNITTSTGTLTKIDAGTLTLSGSNTYTGATAINAGALRAAHANALGTTAAGTTVASGAALELSGGISIGAEALTLSGTGISEGGALRNISGINTYGGLITLGAASQINSDSGNLTISNAGTITGNGFGLTIGGSGNTSITSIIGTGAGTLTKNGTGRLTLSGANTYTGATTINEGILATSGANMLSDSTNITVNSGGTLSLGGTDTVGTLSGAGAISTGANTITTSSSSSATFSGNITGTTGGFTKSGTGTQTLSGTANSWNGSTTVSAGTLTLSGNLGTTGAISISSTTDSVLNITGNLTQTRAANIRNFVIAGASNRYGTVNVSGSGILNISGMIIGEEAGGYAVFNQSGGTVTSTGGIFMAGQASSLNVSGGHFNMGTNSLSLGMGGSATSNSTVTVNGTGSITMGTLAFSGFSRNASAMTVNLGDGTAGGNLSISGMSYGAGGSAGPTTINFNGGTLNVRGNISMITQATTVVKSGGAVIDVDATRTFTISNNLTTDGTGGGLTKNGTGTLTLSGAGNTYTGTTTVNAGTLTLGANQNLGAIAGAGALNLASFTFTTNSSSDTTYSGVISGTGGLTKNGTGTLTLSNAGNTYTGTTTVNAGTLALGANQSRGAIAGAGALNLSSHTLTTNSSSDTTYSGVISGSGGGLTKEGTGTLTLTNTNTYDGSTTINAGTLQIDGNIANSGLVINTDGTISPGTTAAADSFGTSSITINGGGYNWTLNTANGSAGTGWDQITSTGALTTSGLMTIYAYGTPGDWDGSASYSWDIFSADSVSGFSAGNFALDLTNFGISAGNRTGTWSFSNPSGGGIIRLSYAASGDPVWIGGTGNFSTGFSPPASNGDDIAFSGAGGTATNDSLTSVNDLVFRSGAGAYTIAGTALTVNGSIINNSTTTQTFSTAPTGNATFVTNIGNITISGVASGAGRITKNGTATLTLTAANTYTGATTVNAGTLAVTGAGRIDSTSGISVAESATFRYAPNATHTFNRAITGNGTARFKYDAGSGSSLFLDSNMSGFSGQVIFESHVGGFIRTNGNFSSSTARFHLESGAQVVFNGTAQTWGEFSGDSGSSILSTLGEPRTLNFGHLNTDATFAGNLQAAVSLVKEGTGTQTLTNSANEMNYLGTPATITINNGTIAIGEAGRLNNGTYSGAIALTNASSTFHYNSTAAQTLSGVISGAGALVKSQASTLTLSGNNTYTGATTINAGTIEIGAAGRLGAGSYAGNISNNGTFIYSGTNAQTLSGILSGTGALTKTAASTLTLTGNNSYAGATTINAGTLVVSGTGRLGGGSYAGNIAMTGAFTYNSTADQTLSGQISGAGNLNKYGTGILTLSGSNTMTDNLQMGLNSPSLTAGTVKLEHNNAAGTKTIVWENDGTLELGVNGLTISNAVLINNRADATDGRRRFRLDLEGSNTGTFSGNFDIRKISNNGATFDVGADDTLTVSGRLYNAANTGGIEKTGAGTLVLTGTGNDYMGITTISAGTIQVGAGGTTGSLTTNSSYGVVNNGTLVFNRSDAITVANAISGSGNLIQNGSSSLTLTSASSNYSGGTTLNTGTLVIGNAAAAGSGTITQADGSSVLKLDTTGTISNAMSIYNVVSNQTVTLSGAITAQNTTYDVATGTTLSINGSISGSGGVTKDGDGTLELNAANTFTGDTVVNAGTLEANATGSLASTGNITVNGGSLLVGADNAINDSADMNLAGGTLKFDGNIVETLGSLTLTANSVIDMGGGNISLQFSDLVAGLTNTTRLNIYNYTLYSDHLYFGADTNLSSSLQYISFYSDAGSSFIGNSFIEGMNPYQVQPVPEPETWATAALLLIGLGFYARREVKRRRLTS